MAPALLHPFHLRLVTEPKNFVRGPLQIMTFSRKGNMGRTYLALDCFFWECWAGTGSAMAGSSPGIWAAVTDRGRSDANCMMGLSRGSSVVFAGEEMILGSSALRVGLRQQRTLSPGQTNRLNMTLIWRLNRGFGRIGNPKDFESLCRGGDFILRGEKNPHVWSNRYKARVIAEQGSTVVVPLCPVLVTVGQHSCLNLGSVWRDSKPWFPNHNSKIH